MNLKSFLFFIIVLLGSAALGFWLGDLNRKLKYEKQMEELDSSISKELKSRDSLIALYQVSNALKKQEADRLTDLLNKRSKLIKELEEQKAKEAEPKTVEELELKIAELAEKIRKIE